MYNSPIEDSIAIQYIIQTASKDNPLNLYIHDNSSCPVKGIDAIESNEFINLNYYHDPSNPGISRAYNKAANYAEEKGYKLLLFLDQDTNLPKDILIKYERAINQHPDIYMFAPILKTRTGEVISPCRYRFHRGFTLKHISANKPLPLKKFSPINSGLLVFVDQFKKCGGYNEKVRIDFSDFQFIERFRVFNQYFFLIDAVCIQDFSNDESDTDKLMRRFSLYCDGAKNCQKTGAGDSIVYFLITFLRSLILVRRTGNWRFFKIFYKNYLH